MTWLATSPGTKRLALPRKSSSAAVCSQATFDGGPEDPRTLVYLYQQGMRAALLGGVADEVARAMQPRRWRATLAACQGSLATCEDGLRWLWLAEPRRAADALAMTAAVPSDPAQFGSADEVAAAQATLPVAVAVAEAPHPTMMPRPAESTVLVADQSTYPVSIAA